MKRSPQAPKHLSSTSKKWWRQVMSDFDLESHHVLLLTSATELLDRGQDARRLVEAEGAVIPDRFGAPREHPAAKLERDSKIAFTRILRELGLDVVEAGEAARPPSLPSNAALRIV